MQSNQSKKGYLSEVAIALYSGDYEQMLMAASVAAVNDKFFKREFFTRDPHLAEGQDKSGQPVVVLHWFEVKWYRFRPEVEFLTKWMSENARAYKFLRIGLLGESDVEEADTFGDFDAFFSVRRTLKIAMDPTLKRHSWYRPKLPEWAQRRRYRFQ